MKYQVDQDILERARTLRRNGTPAEKLLWERLRARKLLGYKFRRQHPIFSYILDFYCHKAKLAIEIDGDQHEETQVKEYDAKRTVHLKKHGISILRFKNAEVIDDIDSVQQQIEDLLNNKVHKDVRQPFTV